MTNRRAVVLPIPEPAATGIDLLRREWDPVMAGRIGPHLTLVHDVVDHGRAQGLVVETASVTAPIGVTLRGTGRWAETSAYGVFLEVVDPVGALVALHGRLAELETPRWARVGYRPHVTLVHGRTVDPARAEPAWQALGDLRLGWDVVLTELEVLELVEPHGWRHVERHRLANGEARAAN